MIDSSGSDIDFLFGLPRFTSQGALAVNPGFDRITALLDLFGRPDRAFRTVLVAGTNGKGSTASFLAALCTASGVRTGLHTSPHLLDVTERMRVDGRPASSEWLSQAIHSHRKGIREIGPSFFEASLALSLLHFADQAVDTAVVEVGLGGRLDATNVLDAELCVITGIGMDHMDFLGDTIEEIAAEKAGIAKPGKWLVLGPMPEAARSVIVQKAAGAQARVAESAKGQLPGDILAGNEGEPPEETTAPAGDIRTRLARYPDIHIALPGLHQRDNFRTAVRAAELLFGDHPLDPEIVRIAARDVARLSGLRARLEILRAEPLLAVDVAHNPEGVAASVRAFQALAGPGTDLRLIIGMLADKNAAGVGAALAGFPGSVTTVPTPGGRGRSAADLAAALRGSGMDQVREALSVEHALGEWLLPNTAVLVLGSHTVAAELLSLPKSTY